MRRPLLRLVTVLSLLLCVASAALWVRSYFHADLVSFAKGPPTAAVSSEWFVRSNYGILYFARNDRTPSGFGLDSRPLSWMSHPPDRVFSRTVVQWRTPCFVLGPFSLGGMNRGSANHRGFTLPHWSLAALATIGPLVWLHQFRRRRRGMIPGLCLRCGYDLRATPQRCPECGTTALAS